MNFLALYGDVSVVHVFEQAGTPHHAEAVVLNGQLHSRSTIFIPFEHLFD